jgi:hypothetical protein
MTTTTKPDSPEVRDRAVELMRRSNTLPWEAALDQARTELAGEEARSAEGRRKAEEMGQSAGEMMRCAVPQCEHARGDLVFCEVHAEVLPLIRGELAGAEVLPDGRTLKEWATEFVAARSTR